MIIRESLEQEHSKTQTLRIVAYIGNDTTLMAELMVCFFDKEGRICQRAAWAVGLIGEKKPHLIEPYLEQMLLQLKMPQHDAIFRNTMRTLHNMREIPENALGLAVDVAFRFLEDPSVAIAIRAFSMRVLAKICRKEPDLKDELRLLIEDILVHQTSAGLVSTGRDVLKQISG
jgi:pyruvate-formate lyase-activating enzyme